MSVAKLGHDSDGVEPCILGKGGRDDLKGVGVCLEAVGFHAFEGVCVLREGTRDVDLWGASAGNQCPGNLFMKGYLLVKSESER